MKMAKSKKILILLSAICICLITAVSFGFSKETVKADGPTYTYTVVSTTVKANGDTITLVEGYKYKKGSSYLYVSQIEDGTTKETRYDFEKTGDKELSFGVPGDLTLDEDDNEFVFHGTGEAKLKVGNTGKEFTIKVVKKDVTVPTYNDGDFNNNKNQYVEDLKKNLKVKVTVDGEEKEYYKPLGTNKYITLPSMKAFVSDDITPYEEMFYIVHYKNSKSDTTYPTNADPSDVSTLKKVGKEEDETFQIPVEVPGVYYFYVEFVDAHGNSMGEENCEGYVFTFTILENYPVVVNPTTAEQTGYIGVKYTLGTNAFNIVGSTTNIYKLEYSETDDFKNKKDVLDNEEINFDLSDLSFTPTKKGYYKVTCTATSTSIAGLKDDASILVNVTEKPTEINVPDGPFVAWVKGHVVAVIFLCLGFVCLVAIVVLLFIKPKEEIDEEPITKEKVKTKNKNK